MFFLILAMLSSVAFASTDSISNEIHRASQQARQELRVFDQVTAPFSSEVASWNLSRKLDSLPSDDVLFSVVAHATWLVPEGFRDGACFDSHGIQVAQDRWMQLSDLQRSQMLSHEILGYLGLPDRDYRISALIGVLKTGGVRPDGAILKLLKYLGESYDDRIRSGMRMSSDGGGASGARGGGDPAELEVKTQLYRFAVEHEDAGMFQIQPRASVCFWSWLANVDVVSPLSASLVSWSPLDAIRGVYWMRDRLPPYSLVDEMPSYRISMIVVLLDPDTMNDGFYSRTIDRIRTLANSRGGCSP